MSRKTRRGQTQQRKANRRNKWRIVLAVILLLIGGGLLALNPIKTMLIKQGTEASRVVHLTPEKIKENKKRVVTYNFDDIEQVDAASVVRDKLLGNAEASDLPTIGAIAVPDLKINLPIHLGVSNAGMYLGAGTLDPNQEMGKSNYPLASHHMLDKNLLFSPLLDAQYGQKIYLTDLEKVYEYTIDYVEQVPAEAVYLLDPTEKSVVTLITCDYGFVDRVVVRGTLTDEMKFSNANQKILDAFELNENK